jgi:hypothetical protein
MWARDGGTESRYSVFHSKPRARMFSLEYAQLLTEHKEFQAEAVTGTQEGIEEAEEADEKLNHRSGFIA